MGIECSAVRRVATMCLAAIAALGTVPAEAQRSQGEGFARMELQSAGGRHAYARVRFPNGTGAERFVLRPDSKSLKASWPSFPAQNMLWLAVPDRMQFLLLCFLWISNPEMKLFVRLYSYL